MPRTARNVRIADSEIRNFVKTAASIPEKLDKRQVNEAQKLIAKIRRTLDRAERRANFKICQ